MTGTSNGPGSPAGAETTGRIVIALFEDRAGAERAIRELKNAGFSNEQIGAATQDRVGAEDPADEEPARQEDADQLLESVNGLSEGATAGALTGGVIGGLLG